MKKTLILILIIFSALRMYSQINGGSGAISGHIYADPSNLNSGSITPGITFGGGSGEGIASKRNGGVNQYGLDFYTNFTNRMAITNGGKIGIGTTTPQKLLSINGGMNIDQNNSNMGGTTLSSCLTFGSESGEGIGSNRVPGINQSGLDFYTGFAYRMCIMNNGNVGIGTTNPTAKLQVAGAILSSAGLLPSDIRYKKNISPLYNALKTVVALSAFKYFLKTEEFPDMKFDTRPQYGLLAQDVKKVLPEIVYTSESGYMALDYTRIIPFLIEGMKEQQQMINNQQSQIDDLKKMMVALSQR